MERKSWNDDFEIIIATRIAVSSGLTKNAGCGNK